MSDPQRDVAMELRHQDLLAEMPAAPIPSALHRPEFLEGIYERASRSIESEFDADIESALSTPLAAPDSGSTVPEFEPLRELSPTRAPGLLWPRLRADLEDWSTERKRRRTVRRVSTFLSAAAVLFLAVWITRSNWDADGAMGDEQEIRIVRVKSNRPISDRHSGMIVLKTEGGGRAR